MLENIPHWVGQALSNVRAGHDKLTIAKLDLGGAASLDLSSPAFAAGARLPERFTADGEGISPPLVWSEVPEGTASLALIVEDADAPAPQPFVHAIVAAIPASSRSLEEGAIRPDGDGTAAGDTGRNSYFREGWLPPDPPTGHGEHSYVFQLFALDARNPADASPGRTALTQALEGRVLAAGVLVATYSRGEEKLSGPSPRAAAAAEPAP